jgi:hypothetical protein
MDVDYSDEVLEETPQRVTKFLNGIGAEPTIRTLLLSAGMTDADIIEGRTLLLACLAAPEGAPAAKATDESLAQRNATAELDDWDEANFARYAAALRRHYPDAAHYVFQNLSASTGAAAVQGVATFLARIDALEKGSDKAREKTKKDDKKAVELLAQRGLTKKERARLEDLIHVALGPTAPLPDTTEVDARRAERRAALATLKAWFDEWSAAARAVVKKRGYLIRLGLAARKARKAKTTEPT